MLPFEHKVKIKFLVGFRDGNIFPDYVPQNTELEVTHRELEMIKASGGKVAVLGNVIPGGKKKDVPS